MINKLNPILSNPSILTVYLPPSAKLEVIFRSISECIPFVRLEAASSTLCGELRSTVPLVCSKIAIPLARSSVKL